ncbi:hypothetical protein B0O99DRAFT_627238 [Bisporella sp. PMI_857]|nr:hypothetical protein B0O99DRAFT_627238 [Bisporella sp. PMI_857]
MRLSMPTFIPYPPSSAQADISEIRRNQRTPVKLRTCLQRGGAAARRFSTSQRDVLGPVSSHLVSIIPQPLRRPPPKKIHIRAPPPSTSRLQARDAPPQNAPSLPLLHALRRLQRELLVIRVADAERRRGRPGGRRRRRAALR